ncbi:hypothetical protein EV715DRAFT_298427 [Schizophyllum commune]
MKRRYVSGHPLDSSAPTLGCVFADSRLRGQFVRITQFMGSSLPWWTARDTSEVAKSICTSLPDRTKAIPAFE